MVMQSKINSKIVQIGPKKVYLMHMLLTRVSVFRGSGVKLLKLKKEIEFQENALTTIIQNSQKKKFIRVYFV